MPGSIPYTPVSKCPTTKLFIIFAVLVYPSKSIQTVVPTHFPIVVSIVNVSYINILRMEGHKEGRKERKVTNLHQSMFA